MVPQTNYIKISRVKVQALLILKYDAKAEKQCKLKPDSLLAKIQECWVKGTGTGGQGLKRNQTSHYSHFLSS